MRKTILTYCILVLFASCHSLNEKKDHQIIEVKEALQPPVIDGRGAESIWKQAVWHKLDQNWLGKPYGPDDFSGRYKLCWDKNALYILVAIDDNVLYDRTEDPLKLFWNDDSLKVYIDEDNSGGLHQFNHNAFAYHIALDGNVVDLGTEKNPLRFDDHVNVVRITQGTTSTWELAVKLFDNSFTEGQNNRPVTLSPDKKIGFALAYSDNDQSTERENFIGSVFVPGEDKNRGWINADIFGTLILRK